VPDPNQPQGPGQGPGFQDVEGPIQGAWIHSEQMYDHLNAANAEAFVNGGNPIQTANSVRGFLQGRTSQAMSEPRPNNVVLSMAGRVPTLKGFNYTQAANNAEAWKQEWEEIGKHIAESGYQVVIVSSETNKSWKDWHPSARSMQGGENSQFKRAWRNMVNNVRKHAPDTQFAIAPFSGGSSVPNNGYSDYEDWHVGGNDARGKPYMDYWGFTFYLSTQGIGCRHPCRPSDKQWNEAMEWRWNPDRPWSAGSIIEFARSKGKKVIISEFGIIGGRGPNSPYRAYDEPYTIDVLRKKIDEYENDIAAVVWFNCNCGAGNSRLDGGPGSHPKASRRVRELFSY
jgi:hypothetical protein